MPLLAERSRRYWRVVQGSEVQLVVFLMGVWWLPQGPIAYLMDSSFATDPVSGSLTRIWFVPVTVNAWHALFHSLTGALALVAARDRLRATRFGIAVGAVYAGVAAWGLGGDPPLGLLAVDTFGSWVHLIEGAIPFVAAMATTIPLWLRRREQTPTAHRISKGESTSGTHW